jgi:hypothetical protein
MLAKWVAANQTAVLTGNQEVQSQTQLASLVTQQRTAQTAAQDLLTIAHQDQMMEPKDVSGQISHVTARVSQTVQQKRAGQTSLPTETETPLQEPLTREIQDLLNPEVTKQEDHASLRDHQIAAMEQDQVLDTVQIHLSVQPATIAASAPIVRLAISAATLSADPETRQENPEEHTSHVQTRESMTATVTHTAKTESPETSLAIQVLLALATRTRTAKHSLRTRFWKS